MSYIERNSINLKGVASIEIWLDVPIYEKLNIFKFMKFFILTLIGSRDGLGMLKGYLYDRKENNIKYREFWSNTSDIEFNEDKTKYRIIKVEKV